MVDHTYNCSGGTSASKQGTPRALAIWKWKADDSGRERESLVEEAAVETGPADGASALTEEQRGWGKPGSSHRCMWQCEGPTWHSYGKQGALQSGCHELEARSQKSLEAWTLG